MSTVQSVQPFADRPLPNGDPATWILLDELPLPPEVQRVVEARCRRAGFWRKTDRESITREYQLLHHYPGKQIAFKQTPRGMLLLMIVEPYAPALQAFLDGMPRSDRSEVQLMYVFEGDEHPFHV